MRRVEEAVGTGVYEERAPIPSYREFRVVKDGETAVSVTIKAAWYSDDLARYLHRCLERAGTPSLVVVRGGAA